MTAAPIMRRDRRPRKMENRPLTSLRFVAAFYVFCYHMSLGHWPIAESWQAKAIVLRGALGMSVFFVLSGFVMAMRYYKEPPQPGRYYLTRFARIYPVYVLAALVTLPWLISSAARFEGGPTASYVAFHVITNTLLLQAWFPETFNIWNAGGSWSISAEAFFYALFPLIFPHVAKLRLRGLVFLGIGAWLLTSTISLVFHSGMMTSAFPVYYAIPAYRFPEFLLGIAAGSLYCARGPAKGASIGFLACMVALIGYLLAVGYTNPNQPNIADHWITVPLLAAIIYYAGSLRRGPVFAIMSSKAFTYLGHISYSFYSMQLLLLLSLATWHDSLVARWSAASNPLQVWAIAFVALTGLSALCYHLIEEPARRLISARIKRRAHGSQTTALLMEHELPQTAVTPKPQA